MKAYRVKFDPKKNEGVFAISLVENPAMESDFIALKKQDEIKLSTIDEEKRILLGLVLEPNKKVYRNDDKRGEYTLEFDKETVKELAYNFLKSGYQTNSTIEHDSIRLEDVTFVESWIVEDTKKDKSAKYGLSFPVGSWLSVMKVDSEEIWQDYIKTGKVKGFSIDAVTQLEEITLNKIIPMENSNEPKGWAKIKSGLQELIGLKENEEAVVESPETETVETALGSIMTVGENPVKLNFEGETLSVGDSVWIEAEEGERIPAPVGEHELESGMVLFVEQEGVAADLKKAEMEEVEEELQEEPKSNEAAPTADEIKQLIKSVLIKYNEEKEAEYKSELSKKDNLITSLSNKLEEMQKDIVALKEQPAAEPLKATPKQGIAQPAKTLKGRIVNSLNN